MLLWGFFHRAAGVLKRRVRNWSSPQPGIGIAACGDWHRRSRGFSMPPAQYSTLSVLASQSRKACSASSRMKFSVGMVRSGMGRSISS